MTRHGLSSNCINQKSKDIMNSSERYEQANSINNADAKNFKDCQIYSNKLTGQSHYQDGRSNDKDVAVHNVNFENNLDGSQ
jgi:hypothetical protein